MRVLHFHLFYSIILLMIICFCSCLFVLFGWLFCCLIDLFVGISDETITLHCFNLFTSPFLSRARKKWVSFTLYFFCLITSLMVLASITWKKSLFLWLAIRLLELIGCFVLLKKDEMKVKLRVRRVKCVRGERCEEEQNHELFFCNQCFLLPYKVFHFF